MLEFMRNKIVELDKLLAQEKEIIVTRHNIHLARICPVKGKKKRPDHKALRESLAVSGYCQRCAFFVTVSAQDMVG